MPSPLLISLFSKLHESYDRLNSAAVLDAPEPISYYAEILLSLSRAGVHPTTTVTCNFIGEHIDPLLLSDTNATSVMSPRPGPQTSNNHQLAIAEKTEAPRTTKLCASPSASMVRTSRPKISLTECARKMEKSSRAIARHAATISDTLRELDNSRVQKRQRTSTTIDITDQKTSKRPAKAQLTRTPRSQKLKTKSNDKLKKDCLPTPNPPSAPLKQKLRLCRANQIKYCCLMPDDHDSKENVGYGSLLSTSEERQSESVDKTSS